MKHSIHCECSKCDPPKASEDTAQSACNDLLSCPFCGGQASRGTHRISDKQTIKLNGQDTFHFINCIICGSNNQGILGHKTIAKAEEHWNKRNNNKKVVIAIKVLRDLRYGIFQDIETVNGLIDETLDILER
jgi:hypothetical protein